MLHEQRLSVTFEFPVVFERGLLGPRSSRLADVVSRREPTRRHRVAFVVEERVAAAFPGLVAEIGAYVARHATRLELPAPPLVVPGAEACKNDREAPLRLAAWFDALGLDRQSAVVAVGGGALLDLVGFAAAITHRGLRLVRMPTTVLSQDDSGVGVKNGVNAFGKKNFLGTFAPPFAVLVDPGFLATLELRDRRAGMAEAVKVALVKDRLFFEWLEAHAGELHRFEPAAVEELVRRSALLHLDHIAGGGDAFEQGSSRPLDFGHWAAHKLEALSGHALRHGEAVAIGMAVDLGYSAGCGLLAPATAERVLVLLERLGLPTWDPLLEVRGGGGERLVLAGIAEFREHLGGDLTLMMVEEPGAGREIRSVDLGVMDAALDSLRRREERRDQAPASSVAVAPAGE